MYSRAFLNCNNLRDIYYSGSQEDWNQINITGVYRWPSDVTIHYNYPLPFSLSKAPKRAAKSVPSITKTDAVPGEEYILLAVKDSNLKTLLVPDNLLYIDQQTAESSTVTFSYVPRETSDNMSAEIYGKTMQHEHTHTDNDRNCTCDLCGQALAHVFTNYLPDGNATCNVDGTKTAICEICGSKYIAPHHYTWIDLNDATCTANGHSKGVCSVCGAVTVGEIPESAKGHVATDWIYPEGFDCETGGDRYKECTVCHQIIMMETIEGRPHSQWIDPEVPATCTSEGLSAGIHCERCGKILLPQVVLPAGNHQADENGYATLKPATCIEDGEQTATCAICGETFTDTIPATGEHVDEDNDGYCDACEEMMVGPDHCKYCGKIHGGLFGWLVKFFHSILAIFKR